MLSNFPNSFCPIRLNRTPARNIYYKHIDCLCVSRFFKIYIIYLFIYLFIYLHIFIYVCVIAARCFYFFLWLPIKSPLVFSLFLKQIKKYQYHGFPADICQFNMHRVLTPLQMTIEIMKLHHLLSTQPFWQCAVCMHHLSHVQCHNFVGRTESQ